MKNQNSFESAPSPEFETFSDKVLFSVSDDHSFEERKFKDEEKKKLQELMNLILKELGQAIKLKRDEVLICNISLEPAGTDEEKKREIKRIKENVLDWRNLEIVDKKKKEWRQKTDAELRPILEPELKKWELLTSKACIHIEIVSRDSLKKTGRYASNLYIFPDGSYYSKYAGKMSLKDFIQDISDQLKQKHEISDNDSN